MTGSESYQKASLDQFCEQLCGRCKIVRWLGTPGPRIGGSAAGHDEENPYSDYFQLSESCALCQQIRNLVPEGCSIDQAWLSVDTVAHALTRHRPIERSRSYDLLHVFVRNESGDVGLKFTMTPVTHKFGLSLRENSGVARVDDQQITLEVRLLKVDAVDYRILRGWLAACVSHHDISCMHTQTIEVPGLKLIDCLNGAIVSPEDSKFEYAALSYVWGVPDARDTQSSTFPNTILDSIIVTKALGLRYLWVDRYVGVVLFYTMVKKSLRVQCIEQSDDASERHIQINLMDRIYAQALCTIVAATGDAWTGLPGVGLTARRAQERLDLGGMVLCSSPSQIGPRSKSPWAKRAWTFQEGALSRRKIIFDEQEIMYLCEQRCWFESIALESPSNPDPHVDFLLSTYYHDFMPSGYTRNFDTPREHAHDLLSNYCNRALTFRSDAVKACTGALNASGVTHYWGVPIGRARTDGEIIGMSLCWSNTTSGEECHDFPSWSWARWSGAKGFHERSGSPYEGPDVLIEIQLDTEEWWEISRLDALTGNINLVSSSKLLRLTGTTVSSRLFHRDHQWYALVLSAQGDEIHIPVSMDNKNKQVEEHDAAFLLFYKDVKASIVHYSSRDLFGAAIVIVPHLQSFVRIGLAGTIEFGYRLRCEKKEELELGYVPLANAWRRTIHLE